MRRWLTILCVSVVVLAIGVFFALSNASRYLNENRDWVARQVEGALGRTVSFGEIGLSLSGALGVRIADVRIGDDPAYSREDFLVADDARVQVAIWPALRGRYEVRRVVLDSPAITIIQDAKGRNVDSLGRGGAKDADAAPADGSADGPPPAVAIALVSIADGHVRVIDRRGPSQAVFEAKDLDVRVSDLAFDQPIAIDGAAALLGATRQNVAIEGTVGPLPESRDVAAAPVDLAVELDGWDLAVLRRALPDVGAAVPSELSTEGPFDVDARVAGTAASLTFDADVDASRAAVRWADAFAKPAGVPLTLAAEGRRQGETTTFQTLALRVADLRATGKGSVSTTGVDFHLEAAPAPLAPLTALLPALASWTVGGRLGLAIDAKGSTAGGKVPALTGALELRDVSLEDEAEETTVTGLTQTVTFAGTTAEMPPTELTVNDLPLTVAARVASFAPLTVDATVESPGGTFQETEVGQSAAKIKLAGDVLTVSEFDATIFDGTIRGSAQIDRSRAEPRLTATATMENVDVGAAAKDRVPMLARMMSGHASGTVEVSGVGATGAALLQTLGGTGNVEVEDGALRDVNVANAVLGGVTGLPGLGELVPPPLQKKYPELFGLSETRFEELASKWRLVDGVMEIERFALSARDYTSTGKGRFELTNRLDATGVMVLSKRLTEDIIEQSEQAKLLADDDGRIGVPFGLTGSWPKVRAKPDVQGLASALQRGAVRTGLEKLGELLGGGEDEPKKKRRKVGAPKKGESSATGKAEEPEDEAPDLTDPEELLKKGLEGLFGR